MHNVVDFIKWALTHAERSSVPDDAVLPTAKSECGTEPWHYLFGTVMTHTTKDRIKERWENHYSKSWSLAAYENATRGFSPEDLATDCQGLLDAYLTSVAGEKTDINANMNYENWCTDKGALKDIEREFKIGEALFMRSASTGRMSHIGWVCGFDAGGEPLVVEARGLLYGVVVTRFNERPWTHRGLMSKKFDYSESTERDAVNELEKTRDEFRLSSPYLRGESFLLMQRALNAANYTDLDGNRLDEDGIWGRKSQQALDAFIAANAKALPIEAKSAAPIALFASTCGKYSLTVIENEA